MSFERVDLGVIKLIVFLLSTELLFVFLAAVVYTQAYNQVLANQQQQQAAQLIASANPVAAASGLTGIGLLGLAAQQKEGESPSFNYLYAY